MSDFLLERIGNDIADALCDKDIPVEKLYETIISSVNEMKEYHQTQLSEMKRLSDLLNISTESKWDDFLEWGKEVEADYYASTQYTEQELDDMSAAAEAEAQEYAEAFVPKSYAVEVQHAYDKDGNELNAYITLPDEVIEHLGITDSSILDWNVNDDGNVIIKKHIWLN